MTERLQAHAEVESGVPAGPQPDLSQLPVLLVDDEPGILRALQRLLALQGWTVLTSELPTAALDLLASREVAVVVSDYRMPHMDGVTFLAQMKGRWPEIERILLTGFADIEAVERGVNDAAVHRILHKPCPEAVLISVVGDALRRYHLRREHKVLLERLRHRNDELAYVNRLQQDALSKNDAALSTFRRRWDAALSAISEVVLIIDDSLRVEGGNHAAEKLAGRTLEEIEGRPCHAALFGAAERCSGCPLPAGLGSLSHRLQGEVRRFEAHVYPLPGTPPAFVCVYEDVTERAAFQLQASELEKMAAIGRLAGSVAHEINNPLQAILSFVQLAQKAEVPPEKLSRYHQVIHESALRCRDIVSSMKSLSRREPIGVKAEVELREICDKVLVFFSTVKNRDIALAPGCAASLCVLGNANQIHQVVVNLVQNAVDAVGDGGRVQITLAAEGREVILAVEDDGPGVPEAERSRIFEPFYTTKPEGVGTGLGLSISDRIARDHGGHIRVSKATLGGARFELHLPRGRAPAPPP